MSYDNVDLGSWSGMDSDTAQYLMYKEAEVQKRKIDAINREKMKALEIQRSRDQYNYNLEKDRIRNESKTIDYNHYEEMERIKSERIDNEQKRDNERLEINNNHDEAMRRESDRHDEEIRRINNDQRKNDQQHDENDKYYWSFISKHFNTPVVCFCRIFERDESNKNEGNANQLKGKNWIYFSILENSLYDSINEIYKRNLNEKYYEKNAIINKYKTEMS